MEQHTHEFHEVWHTIIQELKKFSPIRTKMGNELGITGIQFMSLKYINFNYDCKPSDISTQLSVSRPEATRIVEVLVTKELVDRIHDEQDRRITHLRMTSKGTEKFEVILKEFNVLLSKILEKMNEDDIESLIKGMKALSQVLHNLELEN